MSTWSKITRGETDFDFVGLRRRWLILSSILVAGSVLSLLVLQLNLGLEFVGGVSVQADNPERAEVSEIRQELSPLGLGDARIQLLNDGEGILVQIEPVETATEEAMIEAIVDLSGSPRSDISIEAVGPTFGALVARQAVIALSVFLQDQRSTV